MESTRPHQPHHERRASGFKTRNEAGKRDRFRRRRAL
jgi:hypothetical protein